MARNIFDKMPATVDKVVYSTFPLKGLFFYKGVLGQYTGLGALCFFQDMVWWESDALLNEVHLTPIGRAIDMWYQGNNLGMDLIDYLISMGFEIEIEKRKFSLGRYENKA